MTSTIWSPVSTSIHQRLTGSTSVHQCPPVSTSPPVPSFVHLCLPVYIISPQCPQFSANVPPVSTSTNQWYLGPPVSTSVYQCLAESTSVYQSPPGSTTIQQCPPVYNSAHPCQRVSTSFNQCQNRVYQYLKGLHVSTSIYICPSVSTNVY